MKREWKPSSKPEDSSRAFLLMQAIEAQVPQGWEFRDFGCKSQNAALSVCSSNQHVA